MSSLVKTYLSSQAYRGEVKGGEGVEVYNHSCGERILLKISLGEDGRIQDVVWSGDGRQIMKAVMSYVSESMMGCFPGDIEKWDCGRILEELEIKADLPVKIIRSLITPIMAYKEFYRSVGGPEYSERVMLELCIEAYGS